MPEVFYSDLLNVKYKPMGRDPKTGLDCYGYVLILCKRVGKNLRDITIDWNNKKIGNIPEYLLQLNVEEIDKPEQNCLIQSDYMNELHIGFMLNERTVTHLTYSGVKTSSLLGFKNKKFYRVI